MNIEQLVIERANTMLKTEYINKQYQTFENKEQAQKWLMDLAFATLVLSEHEQTLNK